MAVTVFVGANSEDSSMYFVGKTIADRIPDSVIVRKTSDKALFYSELVICIDWEWTFKLNSIRRFVHFEKIITVLAGDFFDAKFPEKFWIIANALQSPLIVHSDHSFEMIRAFAVKWLNMAQARKLMSKIVVAHYGVEDSFVPSGSNVKSNWIVPYNRIDRAGKDIGLHAELTSKIAHVIQASTGDTLDTLFIASKNLWVEVKPEEFPAYRFVDQPASRDDYRNLIKDRGMFLCTSKSESFGIYYLELMLTGAVGIFVDKPWVRSLLPGYKHIYPANRIPEAVLAIYQNYESEQKELYEVDIPYIKGRYNLDKFVNKLQSIANTQMPEGGEGEE